MAVFDSRRSIIRARRRAAIRDVAQLMILTGVDWLFMHWPHSHVPALDRSSSLTVLLVLNGAVLTHVIFSRMLPKWSARRIAATWSLPERARFFQGGSEQTR